MLSTRCKIKPDMTDKEKDREIEKEQRTKAGILLAIMFVVNGVHWLLAQFSGKYNRTLAGFAPTMAIMAIYYMIFPSEGAIQDPRKFSVRTWIVLVLAFLFGIANIYAFKHGLY